MTEEKVHVLLTYCDDDNETYCHLFHTKEAVLQYLEDLIRSWGDECSANYDGCFDEDSVDETIAEMKKAMDEKGYWRSEETTYVYDEKEFTA